MLLANFTEEDLIRKDKRDWFNIRGEAFHYVNINTVSSYTKTDGAYKGEWPTRALAEAALAMSQLAWWMRQPEYNGSDQDEWCDWNTYEGKYIICFFGEEISKSLIDKYCCFLAFKTKEIRDRFLEDRRELIEQAKPLL